MPFRWKKNLKKKLKKEEKTFKKNTIFLVGIYFQWKNLKKEKKNIKKAAKVFS